MEILRILDTGIDAAAARAAAVISQGGIVVYPTDTLYGIGVNALDTGALLRLRTLKMRDVKKPLSILVPSVESIEWHADLPARAKELAEKHLPGALTLVLPAKSHLPDDLTHNGSIGVRVPADAFTRAFSEMSEYPITATSANLAGLSTPPTIQEILVQFGPSIMHVDLFVDDGPRAGGTPSTVILFTGEVPYILREGAIKREELGL